MTTGSPVTDAGPARGVTPDPDPAAPTADVPSYTECRSYKEAKHLAASRRHDGTDASAVFVVALDSWCVRSWGDGAGGSRTAGHAVAGD